MIRARDILISMADITVWSFNVCICFHVVATTFAVSEVSGTLMTADIIDLHKSAAALASVLAVREDLSIIVACMNSAVALSKLYVLMLSKNL